MNIITWLLLGIMAIFRPSSSEGEYSLGIKIILVLTLLAIVAGLFFGSRYLFQNM